MRTDRHTNRQMNKDAHDTCAARERETDGVREKGGEGVGETVLGQCSSRSQYLCEYTFSSKSFEVAVKCCGTSGLSLKKVYYS